MFNNIAEADLGSDSGDFDKKEGNIKIVNIKKVNFVSMAEELKFVVPKIHLNNFKKA